MRLLLLFIAALLTIEGQTQDVSFKSSIDTSAIRIGEQTIYHITADGITDPSKVKWPIIADTLHKAVEVIETLPIDTLSSSSKFSLDLPVLITSWDSGHYAIRPIKASYDGTDYETEAILLNVNTVQVDTTSAPMDIKPIYQEPFSFKDWLSMYWPYLVGVAILIAVILLVLRMRRKGEVDIVEPAPVKEIPAHELALGRLKKLKEEDLDAVRKKIYYSELTETLRAYLENRYRVKALEQTSAEILESVRYTGIDRTSLDYLRSLLLTADMVKFAKEKPSSQVMENHLDRAFEFINSTRQVIEEKDSGNE